MVQTPLIYPGGKTLLLPEIRKVVPPHKLCLDLFGGGGAFILDDSHEIGVYNDINEAAVNFFRVLQDATQSARLHFLLERTPYSRDEYFLCDRNWRTVTDPVEKARQWFVVVNVGFTHEEDNHSFRISKTTNVARALRNHVDRLPEVINKLRNITIENLDFRQALSIYGSGKDTLIFADPPYMTRNPESLKYKVGMTPAAHYDLLLALNTTDAMVVLCGYESEMYKEMLKPPTWQLVKKVRLAQVGNADYIDRDVRVEHIWVKKPLGGLFE